MTIKRNLKTQANRDFWARVDAAAAEVEQWPEWKKGGLTVPTRPPRTETAEALEPAREPSQSEE